MKATTSLLALLALLALLPLLALLRLLRLLALLPQTSYSSETVQIHSVLCEVSDEAKERTFLFFCDLRNEAEEKV
jgi:hypothetical protein